MVTGYRIAGPDAWFCQENCIPRLKHKETKKASLPLLLHWIFRYYVDRKIRSVLLFKRKEINCFNWNSC